MRTEAQKLKHREYQKRWTKANPGYGKDWVKRNIERVRAKRRLSSRLYRYNNPEKIRAWKKADRERRKAAITAAKQLYHKRNAARVCEKTRLWRINNRERKRELHRAYKKRHPEKNIEQQQRRRCKILAVGIEDCTAKIKLLKLERFCHWCCTPLTADTLEIDHVIPVSRGGRHAPDNLVAACSTCDQSKGNKLLLEWTWKEAA